MDLIENPKLQNVRMLDRYNSRNASVGALFLTTTHVIFRDSTDQKQTWVANMHISAVEKLPLTTTGSPLLIRCKTFRSITFVIPRERDSHEVYNILQQLTNPVSVWDLHCFRYTCLSEEIPKSAGWNFFDIQADFERMRVPNEYWSLSRLNKNYELCPTYPRCIFVPASATTTILVGSSKFRSKGRLPVLTYLHNNKAAICRCSQPLSGFSARCLEDEQMLECVANSNPGASHMVVVDTRPKINAMANRATGKGYENENFYENIKFHFLGIENIHVMRSSLSKLVDSCEIKSPNMSSYLNALESSGWLKHIKSILDTSLFIAQTVDSGISVLVHCSDGWDRTAQVCSIASMLLDSYYRTIQGYQALIEKDWLNFGHKFSDRIGHISGGDPKEISPIFTQFIDCTWQLLQQFPSTFQFNEHFLLTLHDHASSCQYGTFIGNCEKDRVEMNLSEKTYSLWGYMANHMNEYINPLYDPAEHDGVLVPNLVSQNIRFWRGMYFRFEGGVHPRENVEEHLVVSSNHSSSLDQHIKFLQKGIKSMKELLLGPGRSQESVDAMTSSSEKMHFNKGDETLSQTAIEDPLRSFVKKPIKTGTDSRSTTELVTEQITSLAIDWKSFRNVDSCACSMPFDHFTDKYHCWQCGDIFCMRCIDKHIALPGHLNQCAVPVCNPCYRKIKGSTSIGTP